MKVLVACEFSGVVRNAFTKRGHDAWSCDLLDSERSGNHIKDDVLKILDDGWDLLIAHPPCTHLAVSGARWFSRKGWQVQRQALEFFCQLLNASVPKICVENPISIASTRVRSCDQVIQPWQFGHPETKATCLWLKNLPKLRPTHIVNGRQPRVHHEPPGESRQRERSRTYEGIADAMAGQWGNGQTLGFGVQTEHAKVKETV